MAVETRSSFDDWTKTRTPLVVGTNAGSAPLAFQNWRRFKEAFVPELIARAVDETSAALHRPVARCLDPFAGSGTTPLACQFLGVDTYAIEVNPYLADLVEAKLTVVETEIVARRCGEVIGTSQKVDAREFYSNAPATFIEPGVNGRYLFSKEVGERLASLLAAILEVPEPAVQRLLRVLLGSAALEVCNAVVSGKGRRYRRNWQLLRHSPTKLDAAFVKAVEGAVFDIARYSRRPSLQYELLRGDARSEIANVPDVDLVVFSPPYPNSFDYTDVYNIELWALGYLRRGADNSSLRRSTLRSHVQIKRDFSSENLVPRIERSVAQLQAVDGLWNSNIPDMVGAYFADLTTILAGARAKLCDGGRAYLIVGDSRYAGVDVPVAAALEDMAGPLGFAVVGSEPFRSMRASPQQGGRLELPETLLTFAAV